MRSTTTSKMRGGKMRGKKCVPPHALISRIYLYVSRIYFDSNARLLLAPLMMHAYILLFFSFQVNIGQKFGYNCVLQHACLLQRMQKLCLCREKLKKNAKKKLVKKLKIASTATIPWTNCFICYNKQKKCRHLEQNRHLLTASLWPLLHPL
jgi:hypothetical protein